MAKRNSAGSLLRRRCVQGLRSSMLICRSDPEGVGPWVAERTTGAAGGSTGGFGEKDGEAGARVGGWRDSSPRYIWYTRYTKVDFRVPRVPNVPGSWEPGRLCHGGWATLSPVHFVHGAHESRAPA